MMLLKSLDWNRFMKSSVKDYLFITLSSLLTAIAVNCFFQCTGLAPGGITGLSIIFSLITKIPVSYMTLCISIPLLILATVLLGKSFGIKTLYITLMTPVCMELVPAINLFQIFPDIPQLMIKIIAAIFGGLLVGTAIGLALNHDCATGGTDVIALLIQYFFKSFKLSVILFVLDGSVVIASGFISGDFMIAILSLFSLFIIINTIKYVTSKK